jgi:hypothetical protein
MSQLMEMLTKYEFALNDLAYKLDNADKTNPTNPTTTPPKYDGKRPALDTKLIARHIDFSKIAIPKEYQAVKAAELDDSTRKQLKSNVQYKLHNSKLQVNKTLKRN